MTEYRKREIENLELIPINTPLVDLSSSIKIVSIKHFLKRMIDIVGSLFCLMFFAVFILLIAFVIKLTSKGPIFFKQKRVGYLGFPFTLYKFRTMNQSMNENTHREYIKVLLSENHGQEDIEGYQIKIRNSYTFIGRFLRKTSTDELPQLFNILIGDMSLVGPRPHPDYEVIYYKDWYYNRLSFKPGLTGLSKLVIRDSAKDYNEAMRLDIWYVQNWSITLDIKIIFKTFFAFLKGNEAEQ